MSASKEKKRRQELYSTGQLEKTPGETKRKAHKVRVWITSIVSVILVVLVVGFFAMYNTGFLERHTTAATVGEHKLSAALYNFFYQDVYNSVSSSLNLNGAEIDLSQIPYDETGKTYADYLLDEVNKSLTQTYALYDAAKAENFTLSAADQSTLDMATENLEATATSYGFASGTSFLIEMYGKGSNVKTYEQYVEIMQLTNAYSTAHAETLTYADSDISAYYESNKDALDTVSYHVYECSVPTDEQDENGTTIFDLEASKAQADAIVAAAADGEEAYNAKVAELVGTDEQGTYANGSATLKSDQLVAAVAPDLASWLFDTNRQAGDATAIASGETGYFAVYFVDNSAKYDVDTVNVRHILIRPTDAEDETSMAEAKQKADEILAEYQAGEQTEDAFASLATQYSEDEGTKIDGGLMESMRPGQTVETFDNWSFDAARQPGDVDVIESTYGAHVVYFASNGDTYQNLRIINAMRSRDTNAWAEELGTAYTVTTHESGMKYVNK